MTPLVETPNPNAPGDREAVANAGRRSERRGTVDPSKIDPKMVRAAVASATDFADLARRLKDAGIEAEFDRRGTAAEIYGWRLRAASADEWLKASSVAKDLSWPKISHRFVELDSAKQIQVQPVAAVVESVAPTPVKHRSDFDRMPGVTRHFLQNTNPANQMVLSVQQIEPEIEQKGRVNDDLAGLTRAVNGYDPYTNYGKLLKIMAQVSVALAGMAVDVARAFGRFIRSLLALFGIGLRRPEQPQQPPEALSNLEYRPNAVAELEPFSLPQQAPSQLEILGRDVAKNVSKQESADLAAEAVELALDAVLASRPADLPPGVDGRAELVAAIEKKTAAAATIAQKSEPVAPIVLLKQAMAEFATAHEKVMEASQKETLEVRRASKNLDLALDRRQTAISKNVSERASALVKFLVPSLEKATAEEAAAVRRAEAALEAARVKFPPKLPGDFSRERTEKKQVATEALAAVLASLKTDLLLVNGAENLKAARAIVQTFEARTLEFKNASGTVLIVEAGQLAVKKVAELIVADRKLATNRAAAEVERLADENRAASEKPDAEDEEAIENGTAPRPQ